MTERVAGEAFTEQTVQLDGRGFVSCTFDACRIEYAGGPTEVVGSTFTDCVWHLEGNAANTVALLGGLGASDGPTGPRLVDGLFSQLRQVRGEVAAIPDRASTAERLSVRTVDEVRIGDVSIRTSTDVTTTDGTREGAPSVAGTTPNGTTPNGTTRRRSRVGRWIFASGDIVWIVIAAGVVLASVIIGRTGG